MKHELSGNRCRQVKLDCALLDTTTDKRKTKSITNNASGFALLADWLGKHGVALTEIHAVLEATGGTVLNNAQHRPMANEVRPLF